MEGLEKCIREVIGDRQPVILDPADTVLDAVAVMADRHEPAVLVATSEGLAGIFTERDYLVRVVAAGRSAELTSLGSVMTAQPDTLRLDDCVTYAINRMAVRGYRNVPIVDDEGRPLGVVGVRDLVGHLSEIFVEGDAGGPDEAFNDWIDIGGG